MDRYILTYMQLIIALFMASQIFHHDLMLTKFTSKFAKLTNDFPFTIFSIVFKFGSFSSKTVVTL